MSDTEDGMATEDEEDETVLPPAQMQAEPASTAVAAQNAAQAVATVKAEEQKERDRLEEDAIGTHACNLTHLCLVTDHILLILCTHITKHVSAASIVCLVRKYWIAQCCM